MSSIQAILFLVSAVCFIMALRGLSHPKTAQNGNKFGIAGMVIAIATTLSLAVVQSYFWTIVAIALGALIGSQIAKRVKMTDMPQLVAGFHSLVGLAAVLVAAAAYYDPVSFGIWSPKDGIYTASLFEMELG